MKLDEAVRSKKRIEKVEVGLGRVRLGEEEWLGEVDEGNVG